MLTRFSAPNAPLPHYTTRLVGREELAKRVLDTFRLGARWLSLIGPPGVGKTRLATHVAERLGRDGVRVRFFDLRDVSQSELLYEEIAHGAAYASVDARGLLERVRGYDPDELWILDGCDAVAEALGGLASSLLEGSSKLRLLSTSAAALPVEPLGSVPQLPLFVGPLELDARVQLLADRLSADDLVPAEPAWRDLRAVAEALDGLPLELELVAAQLRDYPPGALLERLSTAGPRAFHGLEAIARSSVARLDPLARRCATAASVFRGGWSPRALAACLGRETAEVLPGIERLAASALLVPVEASARTRRFRLLGVAESLVAPEGDVLERLRGRHLDFFAREAIAHLRAAEERDTAEHEAWLDAEADNLQAALAWAEARGDAERALALAVALTRPLRRRGALERARRTVERIVGDAPPGELQVRAWVTLAEARRGLGLRCESLAAADEALRGAQREGSPRLELLARWARSLCLYATGEIGEASAEVDRGLALAPAAGAPVLANRVLGNGASFDLMTGRYARARERLVASMARARERGDVVGLGHAHGRFALLEHQQGRVHEAADQITSALAVLAAEGDTMMLARFSYSACLILLEAGRPQSALRHLDEAEDRFRRAGAPRDLALAQHARATWLARTGAPRAAAEQALVAARNFEEVGDRVNALLNRAMSAWLHARSGDVGVAREQADIAQELMRRVEDPQVRAAARVYLSGTRASLDGDTPELAADQSDYDVRAARWLVERGLAEAQRSPRVRVLVDGSGFEVPGAAPVDLSGRAALRRIVATLARARGEARSAEALVRAAWPDAKPDDKAARARLYVALSTLRKLGLADVLERAPEGYRLVPGAVVFDAGPGVPDRGHD